MTILNTIQVSGKGAAFILVLLVLAAGAYAVSTLLKEKWFFATILLTLVILFSIFAVRNLNQPLRTLYEVSFDKDYPVSELIENYEIVDQRGNILVVEEKD